MWFIRSLIMLVGIIAVLWVGMNNADQRVDFTFFSKHFEALNLNLLLLLVFVSGMVFSFLIAVINELQLRAQLGRRRREVANLERELSALRNLPLEDAGEVTNEPEALA